MALARYERVAQDLSGNALGNATVDVFFAGTTNRPTLYEDEGGSTTKSNPFNADSNGYFYFYVEDGNYDVKVTYSSTSVTYEDQQIYSVADRVKKSGDTMSGFLTLHADPTNAMHASTKQYVDSKAAGVPVGAILPYGATSPPSGYLYCDGAAVSRTTYANLFAVIGTTFGPGDGSTTFNLPDLRGRAPIGHGQGSGLSNRTIGTKLGTETHTLSVNEIPSHSHTVYDPGHTHGVDIYGGSGINTVLSTTTGYPSGFSTSSSTTGISLGNTGGGQSHNNMQPSLVVGFIIKY